MYKLTVNDTNRQAMRFLFTLMIEYFKGFKRGSQRKHYFQYRNQNPYPMTDGRLGEVLGDMSSAIHSQKYAELIVEACQLAETHIKVG